MTKRYHLMLATMALAVAGCSVHLVAPYDSELEQKASSMEAEVSSWELAMRRGAGTLTDDPRNPDVTRQLDKWRGEASAMLTLIVSADPRTVACNEVATLALKAIQGSLPAALATDAGAAAVKPRAEGAESCEVGLVADLATGIDDIARATQYCQLSWVPAAYFEPGKTAETAPIAPSDTARDTLQRGCFAEFKTAPASTTSAATAATSHGRAVSHLVTTLQVIIYVENRKKAAQAT
jgi:hypothetical protein